MIIKKSGSILVARRSQNQKLPGLWEIPGWRRPRNINEKTFLTKALKTNLNIDAEIGKIYYSYPYTYRKYTYEIKYYNLKNYSGSIKSSLYDKYEWVKPGELDANKFLNSLYKLIYEINYFSNTENPTA